MIIKRTVNNNDAYDKDNCNTINDEKMMAITMISLITVIVKAVTIITTVIIVAIK